MTGLAARLALGTAQFGLAYGATNARGQVAPDEAQKILGIARTAGIGILDTAPAYGDAETVLGHLAQDAAPFRIVTKTLPGRAPAIDEPQLAEMEASLRRSAERLARRPLDAVLVHHGVNLLWPGGERMWALLQSAKRDGLVTKTGVSVYDPEELDAILARLRPDIVQLPFNIFDQRFLRCGALARLHAGGVEVHVRSVFLQGTLLAPSTSLPSRLRFAVPTFARFDHYLARQGLDRLETCLRFALGVPEISALVIGVTSAGELSAILSAAARGTEPLPEAESLAVDDPILINPSKWPAAGT